MKPREALITYKRFKELEKAKEVYFKERKNKEEEYLEELQSKVSFNIKELPNPQPMNYPTFDKYAKLYNPKDRKRSSKKS